MLAVARNNQKEIHKVKNKPILYTLTVWRHDRTCGHDYHWLTLKQALNMIEDLTTGNTCISNPDNRFELYPNEAVV
jgi:hypothetical protein